MKIISACLLGVNCNFEGKNWQNPALLKEFENGELFPVCPEVLGGLSCPRDPSEIQGGTGADVLDGKARVVSINGVDVTEQFLKGARETLAIAKAVGATDAVLIEKSPSCGSGVIFDGSFSEKFKPGDGVTAALLKRNGIRVVAKRASR